MSRRGSNPPGRRSIRVVCTGGGQHRPTDFGRVTATRVTGPDWRTDLQNTTTAWARRSLGIVSALNIPADLLGAFGSATFDGARTVDGWTVSTADVIRAWPHFQRDIARALLAEPSSAPDGITLQPFRCHRCGRSVPLKLETLETRCAQAAASGESRLDVCSLR